MELPKKFNVVVSRQVGDYSFGEMDIEKLARFLKGNFKTKGGEHVEDFDPSSTILVQPGREISGTYNAGVVNFRGVEYPYNTEGVIDWEQKEIGWKKTRNHLLQEIFELFTRELGKIGSLDLPPAWMKNFTLSEGVIYESEGLKIERNVSYRTWSGRGISSSLVINGTFHVRSLELTNEMLEKFLHSNIKNAEWPDYVVESSMIRDDYARLNFKKDFRPIDIEGMTDLFEKIKVTP